MEQFDSRRHFRNYSHYRHTESYDRGVVLSVFFVSFCIIVCALSCIVLFMLHSRVLN